MSDSVLTFDHLHNILAQHQLGISVSEVHGLQMGIMCGQGRPAKHQVLNQMLHELGEYEVLESGQTKASLQGWIEEAYTEITAQFLKWDFSFEPLLPEDEWGFQNQADALSDWCRGFVYGLSVSGIQAAMLIDADAREAFEDLSNIGYVELKVEGEDEDVRSDLIELIEYVKVAVQTVRLALEVSLEVRTTGMGSSTLH